jgi:hypothetical protein
LLLRAPLAKEAGGYALCKDVVFKNTDDPLFQQMLNALTDAHNRLMAGKRFDMPGFRPNEHYFREMQHFGIIPPGQTLADPLDVYAADQAFWASAWHRPAVALPQLR